MGNRALPRTYTLLLLGLTTVWTRTANFSLYQLVGKKSPLWFGFHLCRISINFHIYNLFYLSSTIVIHFYSFPTFYFFSTGAASTWAEWGEWSECNPSSSNGKKFRFRNCNNAPSAAACDGDPTETAPCSDAGCCSSSVSRIRTLESPYQPSCQNTNSSGKFWRYSASPRTIISRKHHNHLLCGLLWQRVHKLQPHEQRHLLPPGQHPRGSDLRPGSQLCGAMLGARSLALSLGELYGRPQNLWCGVQWRNYWGSRKGKVNWHLLREQPGLVHQCQAPVQSKEA